MANPKAIREALIKLMGAKETSKSALEGGAGRPASPADLIDVERNVGRARRDFQEAQGVDPLASPQRMPGDNLPGRRLPDKRPIRDLEDLYPDYDQARFPGEGGLYDDYVPPQRVGAYEPTGDTPNLRVMEDDFEFAQAEFQRLAGRPPSAEEMKNIGTLEKLVDLLKDASGERKAAAASRPTLADDIDDIPF